MTRPDPRLEATGDGAAASDAAVSEADRISEAVLGCPGVARMFSGNFGEVSAYLPGRRAAGIDVDDDRIAVRVVARYGQPIRDIVDQLGNTLAPFLRGRELDIAIEDIEMPGETGAGDNPADLILPQSGRAPAPAGD